MKNYWVYILKCDDGSYYTGHTSDLGFRLGQHQEGLGGEWTKARRPVQLIFSQQLPNKDSAFLAERKIKGWSRAKKEALIQENWDLVRWLAKKPSARVKIARPASEGSDLH